MVAVAQNPYIRPTNTDPPDHIVAVTKSDVTEFTYLTRGIYIGGAGDVAVEALNESGVYAAVTMVGLAVGVWHPVVCRRVLATGTTATNILRGW